MKLPRSYRQFGLRSMLLMTAAVALPMCWYSQVELKRLRLITDIRGAGGYVIMEQPRLFSFRGARVTHVVLPSKALAQGFDLKRLKAFPQLDQVGINEQKIRVRGGTYVRSYQVSIPAEHLDLVRTTIAHSDG